MVEEAGDVKSSTTSQKIANILSQNFPPGVIRTSSSMTSERGHIRERDISGMMGTEPVSRERVSTEQSSERVSTEPPNVSRETSVNGTTENIPPRKWNTGIPKILPHERVFPIQIGSELFRLSGASISSDGE